MNTKVKVGCGDAWASFAASVLDSVSSSGVTDEGRPISIGNQAKRAPPSAGVLDVRWRMKKPRQSASFDMACIESSMIELATETKSNLPSSWLTTLLSGFLSSSLLGGLLLSRALLSGLLLGRFLLGSSLLRCSLFGSSLLSCSLLGSSLFGRLLSCFFLGHVFPPRSGKRW